MRTDPYTKAELKDYILQCIKDRISSSHGGSDNRWFNKLSDKKFIGGDYDTVFTFSKGAYDGFVIREVQF